MSHQTFDEDDLAFEQRLLGAGVAEALPQERTEAALLRFATGLAAIQAGVVGGAALAGPMSNGSGAAWIRFMATAKWVALGAIVGGAATFFWVQGAPPHRTGNAPAVPALVERAALASEAKTPLGQARPTQPAELASATNTRAPRAARAAAVAAGSAARSAKPAADLAAEVAALDGIRTALAIGAWSDAEQQLARYREDFAAGALRTEAEVLAIEALRAQGKDQAASSAAQRFIAQHPRDPQVARVRALTE